jgi:hypothetical protein
VKTALKEPVASPLVLETLPRDSRPSKAVESRLAATVPVAVTLETVAL